jgi:serine/threonine protein kinase
MKYTTKYSQGSVGYRAVELLNTENPFFTKASDIWALGCILFELSYQKKAFPDDIAAWESRHEPYRFNDLLRLQVDERTAACIRELIHRALKIDWWKRPTASDVLHLLDSLLKNHSDSVFYVRETESEAGSSSSSVPLAPMLTSHSSVPNVRSLLNPQPHALPPTCLVFSFAC